MAARPKTLPAGIAPVVMGTAMAFGDGIHHWPTAFLALLGAITIQIGTNFANDYFDFKKGADTNDRIGPTRATQAGLITPKSMQNAFIFTFCLSGLICICLILRAGWPIAIIGILSIICGILYTAGPRPMGYLGLGEILVLIFFGPVAVGGTYYVQSFELNLAVILAGLASGLLSSAILVVNNLRDIDTDKKAGKKTLAVRFGRTFAQSEYFLCVIAASLMPILIYGITQDHIHTLPAVMIALLALPSIHTVFTKSDGPSLNHTLADTSYLLILFTAIFSLGWIA